MNCPHCHAEIPNSVAVCPYCGQNPATGTATQNDATVYSAQTQTQNTAQTAAQPNTANYTQTGYQQTAQGSMPYYSATPTYTTPMANTQVKRGKSGGEIAAIVIAVVVSIISVIAAFVILVIYAERTVDNIDLDDYYDDTSSSYFDEFGDFGGYGIDDFSDEDSLDHLFDYYNSLIGGDAQYPASAPAEEHTAIEFQDYLYSFSDGTISTTYTVELDEVYRGDAALKLIEGAKLPTVESEQEIYLAKFKLTITEQDTEAYVTVAPSIFTAAYSGESDGASSGQYDSLSYLDYKDKNQLLKKGESGTCWMAFVVDKSDERPLVMWDKYEGEYFRYSKAAVSAVSGLEAGAALEKESDVSSN